MFSKIVSWFTQFRSRVRDAQIVYWQQESAKLAAAKQHKEAADAIERVRELIVRSHGEFHPWNLWALRNLAFAYLELKSYEQANECAAKAYEVSKNLNDDSHPDSEEFRDQYRGAELLKWEQETSALLDAKHLEETIALLERLREVAVRRYGELDAGNRWALIKLARAHMELEQLEEADDYYGKAYEVSTSLSGADDAQTEHLLRTRRRLQELMELVSLREELVSDSERCSTFFDLGHYSEALHPALRVVEIYQKLRGPEHSDTLTSLSNVAGIHRRVLGEDDPKTIEAQNNLAMLFDRQGKYGDAEKLVAQAVEKTERLLGPNDPQTLRSLGNLAATYDWQGRFRESEPLHLRVLAGRERAFGPEHPETLMSLNNLAFLYKEQGRYKEAESAYEKAAKISDRVLGETHPSTLTLKSNLASVYQRLGKYAQANPLATRILEDRERLLGVNHPDTLSSLSDLGTLYESEGKLLLAEAYYRRALEGRKEMLGAHHPDTVTSMREMESLYQRLGKLNDAQAVNAQITQEASRLVFGGNIMDRVVSLVREVERLHAQGRYVDAAEPGETAVSLAKKELGSEHPYTLHAMANLAVLYINLGRHVEADSLTAYVLLTREGVLGPDHPDTLRSMNDRALFLAEAGRYREARDLFDQVLQKRDKSFGDDHPDTLLSQANLAGVYERQGEYSNAEPLFERALATCIKVLGPEHPLTLSTANNLAGLYQRQGRYPEADLKYREVLESRLRILGANHPDTCASYNNLAMLCEKRGEFVESEALYELAMAACERALGPEHPNTLTMKSNLSSLYTAQGKYNAAGEIIDRVLEVRERTLGIDHPDTVVSVNNKAALFEALGNYSEAETLYKRSLTSNEYTLGPDNPQTLAVLENVALVYINQGKYRDADPLEQRVLTRREELLGPDHPETLTSLSNLALLRQKEGRYREAAPLFRRALDIRERVLGKEHPATLASVSNLAQLYQEQGRYRDAEPLHEGALNASERVLGLDHPQTLTSATNLGLLYDKLGRLAEAEVLFERARSVWERLGGPNHPSTILAIGCLATVYLREGRYEEATALSVRALKVSEQTLGPDHPSTIAIVTNLAVLYHNQGRYIDAEPLYERAVAVSERAFGQDYPGTITAVNNLASFYETQGRYEEAKSLIRQALEASERTLGMQHPGSLACLTNLASLYTSEGEYEQAELLYVPALQVTENVLGADHMQTLQVANGLARLYHEQEKYAEACLLGKRTLKARERVLGPDHPDTLISMINLSAFNVSLGLYEEAEFLSSRAIDTSERVLGPGHPQTVAAIRNLAGLYAGNGRPRPAFELLLKANSSETRMLLDQLRVSAPKQASVIIHEAEPGFHALISLAATEFIDSPECVRAAVDATLQRKGVGLETFRAQREVLLGDRYPHLRDRIRDATMLRTRFVTLTLAGLGEGEEADLYRQTVNGIRIELETLDKQLMREIPELEATERLLTADYEKVAAALPNGATLIEFLCFRTFDFALDRRAWKPARYAAFVITAASPQDVRMVDLGSAESIDPLVREFRQRLCEGADARSIGEELRSILATVIPKGSDTMAAGDPLPLFLATDGQLNLLPFEALPGSAGRLTIDEHQINYLGSGRDLLDRKRVATAIAPLVVADPLFSLDTAGSPSPPAPHSLHPQMSRSGIRFTPLPGTRFEGERIGRLLNVKPWFGEFAVESAIKRITSPAILHAATHGFFFEGSEMILLDLYRRKDMYNLFLRMELKAMDQVQGEGTANPMLRSGLALAGSQNWLEGKPTPPEAEDGLLTAEDVSDLDLRATEMVVLSACDTAMGDVRRGEGVYGLRRAFIAAGARTLVMSIWKVDDLATALMMERFYQNLLNRRMGRAAALREAKMYLRRDAKVGVIRDEWLNDEVIDRLSKNEAERRRLEYLRSQPDDFRPFREPRFWAAFILHGDVGPLPENPQIQGSSG
jgi:tetratricopeptide (TPR) repeat protein/CHAT domain-containing protein